MSIDCFHNFLLFFVNIIQIVSLATMKSPPSCKILPIILFSKLVAAF